MSKRSNAVRTGIYGYGVFDRRTSRTSSAVPTNEGRTRTRRIRRASALHITIISTRHHPERRRRLGRHSSRRRRSPCMSPPRSGSPRRALRACCCPTSAGKRSLSRSRSLDSERRALADSPPQEVNVVDDVAGTPLTVNGTPAGDEPTVTSTRFGLSSCVTVEVNPSESRAVSLRMSQLVVVAARFSGCGAVIWMSFACSGLQVGMRVVAVVLQSHLPTSVQTVAMPRRPGSVADPRSAIVSPTAKRFAAAGQSRSAPSAPACRDRPAARSWRIGRRSRPSRTAPR